MLGIEDPPVMPTPPLTSTLNERKSSLRKSTIEKVVVEEETKGDASNGFQIVDIKKEQLQFTHNSIIEQDEEFDHEGFNFFTHFLANSQDGPVKDKIHKLLDLIKGASSSKHKLTNKKKNEILRSLKNEFLNNLDELNSKLYIDGN